MKSSGVKAIGYPAKGPWGARLKAAEAEESLRAVKDADEAASLTWWRLLRT